MTKPLGYYIGSVDSTDWAETLEAIFGAQLQLMELDQLLAARASITYWLFHQAIVKEKGDYSLVQAAYDTMTGWVDDEGDALDFCEIVNGVSSQDLESLIECLTSNIRSRGRR